jgi:ribonucleoside-triphosphate reductase
MRSILQLTNQGKNVEHITRVTGYFSKVEHWNKGKQAEFKERYRSKLDI